MSANKVIRDPLWATLVGAWVVAMVVAFFVFVQSGEAAPQGDADKQSPSASITPWIIGGTGVPNGKYPFMVALIDKKKPTNPNNPYKSVGNLICTGTLIDKDSVLTAGHCSLAWPNYKEVYPPQRLRVIVGRTVLTHSQGQVRSVKRIFVHPDFKEFPQTNNDPYWLQDKYDAAVLELSRPVSGIAPIGLATPKQNYLERPGRNATVAGWGFQIAYQPGANWPPESVVQDRLRAAQVPIVSDPRAAQIYTDYMPPIMIAAGGKGKDTCLGDSGGPLFVWAPAGGRYTQIGIVSYGAGCGAKGVPGIYAEVNNPSIRSFIKSAASK
jgi:secreted trypsin-like serine protease